MMTTETTVLVGTFAVLAMLLVAVGLIFFLDSSSDFKPVDDAGTAAGGDGSAPAADTGGAAGAPSASQAWGLGTRSGASKRHAYTTGTRLEELLRWPAADGAEGLLAYVRKMDWEDRETLFKSLPQIANVILGLDTAATGLAGGRGWLNEQAELLHEPNRNPRLAAQLHATLLELLAARLDSPAVKGIPRGTPLGATTPTGGADDGRMGALFERLLEASASGNGSATSPHYSFFAKHLPQFTRLAIANGRVDLVPPIFRHRLQAAPIQAPVSRAISAGETAAAGAGPVAGAAAGVQTVWLILPAWDYFLFCLCLWPLSERGGRALEDHAVAAAGGGQHGAAAAVRRRK